MKISKKNLVFVFTVFLTLILFGKVNAAYVSERIEIDNPYYNQAANGNLYFQDG